MADEGVREELSVLVREVSRPSVYQQSAEFICEDARPGAQGNLLGHVVMQLTNGRTLLIGAHGIWDDNDVLRDEEGLLTEDSPNATFVCWEELLQLLDAWRELARLEEMN